jgi:2-keto-4-pentenoate hydratase/2-oxohepta-3-ene-1,7-dioic acid hydratase in catechol pathway
MGARFERISRTDNTGVGATTQTYLQPGDRVEAEIERLGWLVKTVE